MRHTKIKPRPCHVCGSTSIGVKDIIVSTPWKKEAKKAWAYCKACGGKGPEVICDIDINDVAEINEAYKKWNAKI